jgi:hypothetical protein
MRLYVNGLQITDLSYTVYPSLNEDSAFYNGNNFTVLTENTSQGFWNGYIAEFIMTDGVAYGPTDFGQFKNGIWVPKKFTQSYGSYGFHLDFADGDNLGTDVSGNGLDFTETSLDSSFKSNDSPSNNHCTWDWNASFNTSGTLQNGGLSKNYQYSSYSGALGTFPLKTGKWYFEYDIGTDLSYSCLGLCLADEKGGDLIKAAITDLYTHANYYSFLPISGNGYYSVHQNSPGTLDDNLALPAANDIMQLAYDADTGKMWFGVNNTWGDFGATGVGNPTAGTNPAWTISNPELYTIVPMIVKYTHDTGIANFGQQAFAYTPPSGFKALCHKNLPEPSILEPSEGVEVLLYTGDNVTPRSITGVGFAPDFVWVKNRSGAWGHNVADSVRGNNSTLYTNANSAATASHTRGWIDTLDSDGFTVKRGGTDAHYVNYNAEQYVAWCLKKGSEYGFDIQQYTGNGTAGKTVSHNLGGVPELVIVKNLNSTRSWRVYHHHALNKTDPETDSGILDTTALWADSNLYWNDTAPTSTVVTLGSNPDVNQNTSGHIMYLWRSIEGFSKVFSFEGNGNANGPYIYCGFKPRWVFWKDADGAVNWNIYDTARDVYNGANTKYLAANEAGAETATGVFLDFYSNGFKMKSTFPTNAHTTVGIAFAEQPGKYSNAR